MHLTTEQEQRLQTVVKTGAYPSTEAALNAAVAAVETAAAQDFEGTDDELEILLLRGGDSPTLSEDRFWNAVDRDTDALLNTQKPVPYA